MSSLTGAALLDPALSLNDITAMLDDLLRRRSALVLGVVVARHSAQCHDTLKSLLPKLE